MFLDAPTISLIKTSSGILTIEGTINPSADSTYDIGTNALRFSYGYFDKLFSEALSLSGQLSSTLATGTPPFVVVSSTGVTNLNADLLDGYHASYFQSALTTGNMTASSPIVVDQTRQVIGGAVVLSHVTTAGNIHLPTGGSSNQLLKNSGTSGTGAWGIVTESAGTLGMVSAITDGGANITIENNTSNMDIVFKVNDGGVDTEVIRIDGDVNRVGIGTATPAVKLDVLGQLRVVHQTTGIPLASPYTFSIQGPDATTGTWMEILNGTVGQGAFFGMFGTDFYIYDYQGGATYFMNGPSAGNEITAMTVSNKRNLGIGTTTPVSMLEVYQITDMVGTVATNGTTTLTGTNTQFTNDFKVGDTIKVVNETNRVIATITSDTVLTSTVAFSTTASGRTFKQVNFGSRFNVKGNGNVGINTTSPDERLQVVGTAMFGEDVTNYSKFESDGTLVFKGTATVYNDVQFSIQTGRVAAANFPDWDATFTANTGCYKFDVDDYIDLSANELPHSWEEASLAYPHVHIALDGANDTGASRWVKFIVYLAYADVNEVYTETNKTIEIEIVNGTADLTHLLGASTSWDLAGVKIGAQIVPRLKRIAATSGTEYANHVFVTQFGIHIIEDTVGSRTTTAK